MSDNITAHTDQESPGNGPEQPQIVTLSWGDIDHRLGVMARQILYAKKKTTVWGIPRGGAIVAGLLAQKVPGIEVAGDMDEAEFIVDDIYDSGATWEKYHDRTRRIFFLVDKRDEYQSSWVIFPWEEDPGADVAENVRRILQSTDPDPHREGLAETPERYMKFLNEFLSPKEFKPTTFSAEGYDQMIIQTDIPFYSLCEHHLVPFHGTGTIAYIPRDKIIGLSKLARTLDYFARRYQNQERITQQVAEFLQNTLQPDGVGVVLKAEHLCMSMRGIEKPGTMTTTSAMEGVFREDLSARNEFLNLLK